MIDKDYVFGRIYDKKIDPSDAYYYANLFGEDSIALTALIKYCIENNIRTFASCKGHPAKINLFERSFETGYIAFRIYDDIELAYFLASLPHRVNGIMASVENLTTGKSISIYVPAINEGMSEIYFNEILEQLKMYDKDKDVEIDSDVKKIVDYVMETPRNIWFDITDTIYRKVKRIDNMQSKMIAKCPKDVQTNMLHNKFCELLGKPRNVSELINYVKRK